MPAGSMRPAVIAASMPLTSFGAAAEMRWTFAMDMSATGDFEVVAHHALQRRQRGGEHRILRDAVTETREQILVHRGQIDARHLAVTYDGPAADDQLLDVPRGRAREQQVERIETGAQTVGVELRPVDQQNIRRRARCERAAFVLVRDRTTAVDEDRGEDLLATDIDAEPDTGVQQVGQSHLAQ